MAKKSSKRFTMSDSRLNSQGFRLLTSGGDLEAFKNNPLLLWNHQRPSGNRTDQVLPLGWWEDLKVDGDEISGVPVFDEKDDFAMKIYEKVEAGIIKMCSAGARILQTSNDPAHILPGQTKETATLWQLMECSLTDIGSNPGSMAVTLYDKDDNVVNLSDSNIQTLIPDMTDQEKAALAAKTAADVKLAADTAATVEQLKKDNADLQARLEKAESEAQEAAIASLVDGGVKDKKFTEQQKPLYAKLAAADFEGTAALIKGLPSDVTLADQFAGNPAAQTANTERLAKLSAMSGKDLYHESGGFAFLRDNAPEIYKLKYKEKFGVEPRKL